MGFKGRKKEKYQGTEKFIEKMKEIQEETKAVLGKTQEEMKKYVDRKREEVNNYKVRDLVMLSTKDLKYQMVGRRTEKLIERFIGPYKIKKIVLLNIVELELLNYKKAKLQAGIKPTVFCSATDKENSIEFLLDFATLYIQLLLWLCTLSSTVLMSIS